MAVTAFGAASDMRKKVWSIEVSRQGRDKAFFTSNGFEGKRTSESTLPIQRVTELTKTARGIQAVLPLVRDLSVDSGVVGSNILEGQEAPLIADSQTITIDQIRNGVKNAGYWIN